MDLSQEDPIPLFVEGQDLLTQDVLVGDGVTETRHFRPSNLHAWKLYGPSWGRRAIPGKLHELCQGPYVNHYCKCTNPIGQDSWRSVGQKDGKCFESEVIISTLIWCASSETGCSHIASMIISHRTSVASVLHHWVYDPAADPHIKLYPSKNYWQFSSTILIQFSCNSHAIIDEIFRNAPAILTYNSHPILTYNSHPILTRQFSSNSHLQFSSNSHLTILIQFSPDNSHPIFTWQFSSNSHLQFSLNSHQHCSVNSHQQCSANFLVMISQSVLISHAAIFIQCWFYNGSE